MKHRFACAALFAYTVGAMVLSAQDRVQRPDQPTIPLINALDANHDGVISKEEIAGAATALRMLDKNGDGALSRPEWMGDSLGRLRPARPGRGGPPNRQVDRLVPEKFVQNMLQHDANEDGKISKEEAPGRMKQNFTRFDRDGDGFLTENELKSMAEQLLLRAQNQRRGVRDRPETEGDSFGP